MLDDAYNEPVTRGFVLVAIVGLVACGDGLQSMPDGATTDDGGVVPDGSEPDGSFGFDECWPDMERHPTAGFAVLGAGEPFADMPGEVPLAYGPQGGFMTFVNVRMSGFSLGNPRLLLDPSNPRTRLRVFMADTNKPLMTATGCNRDAYEPSPAGGYELVAPIATVFDLCWRSDWLIGAKVRIEMELTDMSGAYASDSKIVTLTAPPPDSYPDEHDTEPCPDGSNGRAPVTSVENQPVVEIRSGT